VGLGDLSSTIALAPMEQLTIEIRNSQRRLLEKQTLDSAEEMTSTESTTIDKEVLNVANSSSKTENWSVSGNGSFSLGGVGNLGVNAMTSGSFTENSRALYNILLKALLNQMHSIQHPQIDSSHYNIRWFLLSREDD